MDSMAGYAWEFSAERIRALNIREFIALETYLENQSISLDDVGNSMEGDQIDNMFLDLSEAATNTLNDLYHEFTAAFLERTGVTIWLSYITDGSENNEVSGAVWSVQAVEITPAAHALGITWDDQKFFTVFG